MMSQWITLDVHCDVTIEFSFVSTDDSVARCLARILPIQNNCRKVHVEDFLCLARISSKSIGLHWKYECAIMYSSICTSRDKIWMDIQMDGGGKDNFPPAKIGLRVIMLNEHKLCMSPPFIAIFFGWNQTDKIPFHAWSKESVMDNSHTY